MRWLAVLLGGNWNNGANSGSRNWNWNNAPSNSNNNIGARGRSDDLFPALCWLRPHRPTIPKVVSLFILLRRIHCKVR